ncbi:MAG: Rrf2 family transcriptional regulator [Planctomycetota bacterium]
MSRSTAYAVGALLQLANAPPDLPVPCSQLAKTGEMPERFLLQILRQLVNHGILTSTRGVDGGYALARPVSQINLLQIFEATDGPMTPSLPPLDSLPASAQEKLLSVLTEITAEYCQSLGQIKLSELHNPKPNQMPPKPQDSDQKRKPK